jgi:CheY-like chemotaxis protein
LIVLDAGELVASALSARGVSLSPVAPAQTGAPTRILVVDDSITTRTLERNILEGYGYDVSVATDGHEAWETVRQARFDLVVTDIEMPRMNGFELTERIKQTETLADIPVIIVSSLAADAEKRRGLEVGADAYITKGEFETGVLLDVVAQHV